MVQTHFGQKLTDQLNKKYGTSLNVGKVGVNFFGEISLKDIYIKDHHKDTLAFIRQINTSIQDYEKLKKGDLLFTDIEVEGLDFIIKNYKNEVDTNLDVFIARWEQFDTLPQTGPSSFLMKAQSIAIKDSRFRYVDDNLITPKVVDFKQLYLLGKSFEVRGPNVSTRIIEGAMQDHRGLSITHLSTNFSYTLKQMKFENIALKTPSSVIDGTLNFLYKREDFSDFNNKVKIQANFNNSVLSYKDLNKFYDEFGKDKAFFSTQISGTLNDLKTRNFKLQTLNNTKIDGELRFKNLFTKNEDDFKLTAQFKQLKSTYTDLKKMLPDLLGKNIPSSIRNLGVFKLTGSTQVTTKALHTNAEVLTSLGAIQANLKLTDIDNIDNARYEGETSFVDFDLGRFLDDPDFGTTSFNVHTNGKGFTLALLDTQIKGKLDYFTYNAYSYKNLSIAALVKNKVFNGSLIVNDPNTKLRFEGLVDMENEIKEYDFKANVSFYDLNKTHWITRDSIAQFKGDIVMKMKGSNLDNAYGKISFINTSYTNQNDLFYFKDFTITSSFDKDNVRTIAIQSPDVIEGKIEGNYRFKDLLALTQNSLGSIYTHYRPLPVAKNQFFNFSIQLKNKLTEIFYPDLVIYQGATLRGTVSNKESEFKLRIKAPKVSFKNQVFNQVNLQLDNANPLYNAYLHIDEVDTDYYNVSEFNLINKTLNDTLFFRTEFKGGENKTDAFNLNLYHTINKNNRSVVGFKKSDIKFNEYDWVVNKGHNTDNKIEFDKTLTDFLIKPLVFSHKDEELKLFGSIQGTKQKDVNAHFTGVKLEKLFSKIEDFVVSGVATGKVNLKQQRGKYKPLANVAVDQLTINDKYLGRFTTEVTSDNSLSVYQFKAQLLKDKIKSITARGSLDTSKPQPWLDLDLGVNGLDLSFLSPLGTDVITNIRGAASGDVHLFGNYDNPDFKGYLYLDEAGLKIPYLNIDFDFENNAKVLLNKKQFVADNIALLDTKYYTSGRLNGYVEHHKFTDWILGLDISSDRLLVLDKEQEEESLYFGEAYIKGNAQLTGPSDQLVLKVNALTEKGTVFKIPISDSETIGDNSFIKIVSKDELLSKNEIEADLPDDISGLELEFDLNVTDDAEIEIVLDKESGSVLRGRGAGLLRIEINTNDKFNMYGDCIVTEGTYNFVYGNNFLQGGFIEKRFNVKSGGTINWDGNPYKAKVNIEAAYATTANPAILLDNPTINRKIPVEVIINLNGDLLQPDVDFDIEFPNTNSVVKSELLYKLDDKEFRDRQAMALVTSGQFTTTLDLGKGAITNLVERATSLVNDLFSDDDDKVKVGVNYEHGEVNPLANDAEREGDRVGFTVSTQITDRIILNGKVGVPLGGVTRTVVAGDVQVEFLLNEKGNLRAKIFNRENDFQALGATNEIGYTQGVGISYQVDFDTFSELIDEIFNRKKEEKAKEKDENANDFIQIKSKDEQLKKNNS